MQIARQTARGTHHHIGGSREIIHRSDHFSLTDRQARGRVIEAVHFPVPLAIQHFGAAAISAADAPAAHRLGQRFEAGTRIGHQWQGAVLESVKLGDVQVDELDLGVLKRSLGRSGEITVTCADSKDEVRFTCDTIRRERACDANSAEVLRMVVRE